MKFTASEYAKKHNIVVSTARDRLNKMCREGMASRVRDGSIGGTFAYEIHNELKAHDPFNLGAAHKRRNVGEDK